MTLSTPFHTDADADARAHERPTPRPAASAPMWPNTSPASNDWPIRKAPPARPWGLSPAVDGAAAVVAAAVVLLLAGCSAAPVHTERLYRLPVAASQGLSPPASSAPSATAPSVHAGHVQLLLPVELPELIDRDALLLPQGGASVLRPSGHQWAEPLRQAVPRSLWTDLAARLGQTHVVLGAAPPGWRVDRQLKVQLLQLEASPDQREVRLLARWSVAHPQGASEARLGHAQRVAPVAGAGPEAIVQAHRDVLALLAQRLAQDLQESLGTNPAAASTPSTAPAIRP